MYYNNQPLAPQQAQQTFGQPTMSQYRGPSRTFQPTGNVPSYYNPQAQQFVSNQNPMMNAYHLPHYVGNQIDHDMALREDSLQPSTYATHPSFVTQPHVNHYAHTPSQNMRTTRNF